jgi:hypothetical protein
MKDWPFAELEIVNNFVRNPSQLERLMLKRLNNITTKLMQSVCGCGGVRSYN